MIDGSILIALIFKVHYKTMISDFSSKIKKLQVKKVKPFLLQTDLSRSNSVISKSIQWKDINIRDEGSSKELRQPKLTKPHEPSEANTQTIDLGRVSQLNKIFPRWEISKISTMILNF
ncbi:hypothetical protein EUTSA_v10003476mg [Eutrema salsugineum]|uniref:Uncharacterized protein n=1 Tax=Eutrema salsugineum TaxID=72664 RepID=V4L2L9_EUTSA|nr:hypothetical protein EUTSA_v10003476mg [Eutrema salsugineum]